MNKEAPMSLENQRELVRVFLTKLGGVAIVTPDMSKDYKFVALLPVLDEWTRLFSYDGTLVKPDYIWEKLHIQNVDITDSTMIFLRIDGNVAKTQIIETDTSGWNEVQLQRGYVLGFREKPLVFDRAQRVLSHLKKTASRFIAVGFPIDNPNDHKLMVPIRMGGDDIGEDDF